MEWETTIREQGRLLGEAARRDPSAAVPAAADFDTTKLLRHVTFVLERVAAAARTGDPSSPFRRDDALPAPPGADEVFDRYGPAVDAAADALAAVDPEQPMWTQVADAGRAGFWRRRLAHELTVHRVDAEQAVGGPVTPVTADLAVDGVDELLEMAAPRWPGGGDGATAHLHATDAEGEWLVTLGPDALTTAHGHAKGDVAVRGPAADLYLWLWGRAPFDGFEVFGDRAVADRLRQATTI
jgi:uncharacterized protein (TIGR03083 family)